MLHAHNSRCCDVIDSYVVVMILTGLQRKSLDAFRDVMTALASADNRHVPYGDTLLTRMLEVMGCGVMG